jgi:hypothetical protein
VDDASKNSADGASVKRAAVDLLQPLQDVTFAVWVAKRQLFGLFECSDLEGEACPHVQQAKQFGIDFVDFFAPIIYVHNSKLPGVVDKKKQPRLFRIAAGSLKVLCFFLGLQHIVFKLRRSALLVKEEAVSKGEVEKCTSANHDLGYYRRR